MIPLSKVQISHYQPHLRDIQGHFVDLCVVEFCPNHDLVMYPRHTGILNSKLTFNVTKHSDVVGRHKVDGDSLTSEPSTTANTVDVIFTVGGQVIVDDQRNLLHIDSASKEVGCNKNTRGTRSELLHQNLTLFLFHITMLQRCLVNNEPI